MSLNGYDSDAENYDSDAENRVPNSHLKAPKVPSIQNLLSAIKSHNNVLLDNLLQSIKNTVPTDQVSLDLLEIGVGRAQNTLLHIAARKNNPGAIKLLLEYSASKIKLNKNSQSPFDLALSHKANAALLELLKSHDGKLSPGKSSYSDEKLAQAVFQALGNEDFDSVRSLLKAIENKGALADVQDSDGTKILHLAALHDQTWLIKILFDAGARDLYHSEKYATALEHAVISGSHQTVKLLLQNQKTGAHGGFTYSDFQKSVALYAAIAKDDNATIELLKCAGARLDAPNKNNDTLLHRAAQEADLNMLRILLNAGFDKAAENEQGETPLSFAAKSNSVGGVSMLLRNKNGDIIQNENSYSDWQLSLALYYSIGNQNSDIVNILTGIGVDLSAESPRTGESTIHLAARDNDVGLLSSLLQQNPMCIRAKTKTGNFPLDFAISNKSHSAMTALLSFQHDDATGYSPWELAESLLATLLDLDADGQAILLEFGATIDATNRHGETLMHISAARGDVNAMGILHSHGLSYAATNNAGQTPLYSAASSKMYAAMTFLIQAGGYKTPTPDHTNDLNKILIHSIHQNDKNAVITLLRGGANPNAPDDETETAMHHAAQAGNPAIIGVLISHGGRANVVNAWDNTPLHLAANGGSYGAMELLLLAPGAEVDMVDKEGGTALYYAAARRDFAMVTLLFDKGACTTSKHSTEALNKLLTDLSGLGEEGVGMLDFINLKLAKIARDAAEDTDSYTDELPDTFEEDLGVEPLSSNVRQDSGILVSSNHSPQSGISPSPQEFRIMRPSRQPDVVEMEIELPHVGDETPPSNGNRSDSSTIGSSGTSWGAAISTSRQEFSTIPQLQQTHVEAPMVIDLPLVGDE